MAKREPVSKRTRFEVFKRDGFKCQYCGRSAPEIVLCVDHIDAVKNGGGRDILNLITACYDCNSGKSSVPISDHAAVSKQVAVVRHRSERLEQLEMLVQWRNSLEDIRSKEAEIAIDAVNLKITPWSRTLNSVGRAMVRDWVSRFGLTASLGGIDNARPTLSYTDADGDLSSFFAQMERFAAARAKVEKDPILRDLWRVRYTMRSKGYKYGKEWAPVNEMRRMLKDGLSIEDIEAAVEESKTWDEFLDRIEGQSAQ